MIVKLAWGRDTPYNKSEYTQLLVDRANRELDMFRKINELVDVVNTLLEKTKQ